MQDEPHPAPGSARRETPYTAPHEASPSLGKRPSTAERVRRRYRLARRLLTAAGLAIALAVVAASVAALPDPAMALERGFLAQSVVLLVAAGGVPWVVVGSLGRRAWRRHL
jgi:hypothetical protein